MEKKDPTLSSAKAETNNSQPANYGVDLEFFINDLGLCGEGLDPTSKEACALIPNSELEAFFGEKKRSGYKYNSAMVLPEDQVKICELFKIVYGHKIDNTEIPTKFARGFLAQRKGKPVNWALYAMKAVESQGKQTLKKSCRLSAPGSEGVSLDASYRSIRSKMKSEKGNLDIDLDLSNPLITVRGLKKWSAEEMLLVQEQLDRKVEELATTQTALQSLELSRRASHKNVKTQRLSLEDRKMMHFECSQKYQAQTVELETKRACCKDIEVELQVASKERDRIEVMSLENPSHSFINELSENREVILQTRELSSKVWDEVKKLELEYEIESRILDRERQRVEQIQANFDQSLKEYDAALSEKCKLDVRIEALQKTKDMLASMMNHMSVGTGVSAWPLPMEHPEEPLYSEKNVIFVKACPVCERYFTHNAMIISSCGCSYHSFCMAEHIGAGNNMCAYSLCEKRIHRDWFTAMGYGARKKECGESADPSNSKPQDLETEGPTSLLAGSSVYEDPSASMKILPCTSRATRINSQCSLQSPRVLTGIDSLAMGPILQGSCFTSNSPVASSKTPNVPACSVHKDILVGNDSNQPGHQSPASCGNKKKLEKYSTATSPLALHERALVASHSQPPNSKPASKLTVKLSDAFGKGGAATLKVVEAKDQVVGRAEQLPVVGCDIKEGQITQASIPVEGVTAVSVDAGKRSRKRKHAGKPTPTCVRVSTRSKEPRSMTRAGVAFAKGDTR